MYYTNKHAHLSVSIWNTPTPHYIAFSSFRQTPHFLSIVAAIAAVFCSIPPLKTLRLLPTPLFDQMRRCKEKTRWINTHPTSTPHTHTYTEPTTHQLHPASVFSLHQFALHFSSRVYICKGGRPFAVALDQYIELSFGLC